MPRPPMTPGRGRGRPMILPRCAPFLEKNVELSREYAGYFAPYRHVADPMIDDFDAGMTTESVRALFAELRRELVPIVRAICEQAPADDQLPARQLCRAGAARFRQSRWSSGSATTSSAAALDKTHHPFCTKFSAGDVRITTRVDGHDIGQALFSTVHEAGSRHVRAGRRRERLPIRRSAAAPRPGVHESQSRLWENVVAREPRHSGSTSIRRCSAPSRIRSARVALETFYRAINKVAALADPHRCRRGDLQSSRHDALRPRAGHARRPPQGQGPARSMARAHQGRSRRRARRTIATAASRTCIGSPAVSAAASRATPSAISSAPSSMPPRSTRASGHSRTKSPTAISARCATGWSRTCIATAASSSRRTCRARDRHSHDDRALSRLSARKIRRTCTGSLRPAADELRAHEPLSGAKSRC